MLSSTPLDSTLGPLFATKTNENRQKIVNVCRVSLDVIAISVQLVALILTAFGLFTSAWQVGDLFELGEYHEYGLWEDCVKGWTRTAGAKNELICFYKQIFYNDYGNFQPFYNQEGQTYYQSQLQRQQLRHDQLEPWRLATFACMSISFGLGFFALFLGCCGTVCKCPAVTWAVLTTLSTLCSLIAVIIFAVNTTYPQNRFVLMTMTTAELRLGRSYYLALAGAMTGLVATVLSIACVVLLCMKHSKYLTGRKHRMDRARRYVERIPAWPGFPRQTVV